MDEQLQQLIATVEAMRAAQRAYFKTHGGLDDCRRLEREVDRQLRAWHETQGTAAQPLLF